VDIKLVTWDVDGTLFSFRQLAAELIRLSPKRIGRIGLMTLAKELSQVWRFHRIVERQRRTAVVVEEELRPFHRIEAEENYAMEVALRSLQPSDNVLGLLRYFKKAGVLQVALSDFDCGYKIEALGLSHFFARTYSCRSFGYWKPSPIPFDRVEQEFGISPRHHVHIGDRLKTDGLASARTGCGFVPIQQVEAKMLEDLYADIDSAGLRRPERTGRPDRGRGCASQAAADAVPADWKHSERHVSVVDSDASGTPHRLFPREFLHSG
jgi:FMN phosphatase YigB (HAD superfamily)